MGIQDPAEAHETEGVALVEDECEDHDVQRCVSETRSLPETTEEHTRLHALEVRVGNVLSTPLVSLMSQVALEFEMLV